MWQFFWDLSQKLSLSSGEETAAVVRSKKIRDKKGAGWRTDWPLPPRVDRLEAPQSVGPPPALLTPTPSSLPTVILSQSNGAKPAEDPADPPPPAHRDRWCCCCCWGRIPPAAPAPRSAWLAARETFRPRWTAPSGAPGAFSSASAREAPAGGGGERANMTAQGGWGGVERGCTDSDVMSCNREIITFLNQASPRRYDVNSEPKVQPVWESVSICADWFFP